MSALISLRLDEVMLREVNRQASALHVSKTEYIRQAILLMSRELEKKKRRSRLMRASLRVRKNSMKVNAEFSECEHDPEV